MSSPLTLAQVRWAAQKAQMDWCPKCRLQSCSASCDVAEELALVATIEWLAERVDGVLGCMEGRCDCDPKPAACEATELNKWLRGEA
jgi:hypothetical protein